MKQVFHLITTICRGGAENQLLILVEEQIRQGFDVHIVYLKDLPELSRKFEDLGAEVHSKLAGAGFIRQPFLFRKLVSKKDAIVHAHLPRAELVAFLTPARFLMISSRHNAESFFPTAPKFISNWLSKIVSIRCRKIIAISEAVKKFMIENGEIANPQKITVVHYGFLRKDNQQSKQQSINSNAFRLGSISRLTYQKDIPTMLTAFRIVKKDIYTATLKIVGSGVLEPELKSIAQRLYLTESIEFLGRTDKITEFLSQLDVFIFTSRYEGFGLVLLEAMDACVPIVASRNSAIVEVLGSDFPGLCETSNAQDFAKKILKLRFQEYRNRILEIQKYRLSMFDSFSMSNKVRDVYSS